MAGVRPLCLMALVLVSACAEPQAPSIPAPDADACGAARLQGLVGQSATVLDDLKLPADSRVIGPDQPVTSDFRPGRLNVETGRDGRIVRIGCY